MGLYSDDLYINNSYGQEDGKIYTDVEIFEEFLTYCTDYEIELGDRIVIKNGENRFTVFMPNQEEPRKYIIYEGSCGGRFSGIAENIEELLENAIEAVGEEKIKLKQKGKR